MNVLIVYAHEEPHSFNAAMKKTARRILETAGHAVAVTDLYRMGFKAVADAEDFLERQDRHVLKRQQEELAATRLGTLAHDILTEQEKVKACDLLILQFPLWWFGMPAILKGWVDRVFSMGFAYGDGKWYDEGCLKGRRAMLALTTGDPESAYTLQGRNGPMERVLFPIHHGVLSFCGFQVLPPFVAYGPAHADAEQRDQMLLAYEKHLGGIEAMEPLPFHPLSHFEEGLQLKPEHC